MTTLTLTDVSTGYHRPQTAVDHASLAVRGGEIVALLGPNGAGKTSSLAAVSGLLTLWGGQIDIDGRRLDGLSPAMIVRSGVAQVPEGRRILPGLTVAENLEMGAYVIHDRSLIAATLDEVLGLFPALRDRLRQLGGTLSGGEQEMLAIGRALMSKPSFLLLDEPSMGLAPVVIARIFDHLRQLQGRGLGILLVEQNARMALEVATFAHVLERGSVVISGKPEELISNEMVRRSYLGA